jgi:hypothetical protein
LRIFPAEKKIVDLGTRHSKSRDIHVYNICINDICFIPSLLQCYFILLVAVDQCCDSSWRIEDNQPLEIDVEKNTCLGRNGSIMRSSTYFTSELVTRFGCQTMRSAEERSNRGKAKPMLRPHWEDRKHEPREIQIQYIEDQMMKPEDGQTGWWIQIN